MVFRPHENDKTLSSQRGSQAEELFSQAVIPRGVDTPSWLNFIRMATALEDSSGVDAVASLDVGEVNIQIKSSVTGVYKHMLKYGNKHLIIVVTPGKTPEVVRREVYIHLRNFRDGRLAEISRK